MDERLAAKLPKLLARWAAANGRSSKETGPWRPGPTADEVHSWAMAIRDDEFLALRGAGPRMLEILRERYTWVEAMRASEV